MGTAEVSVIIPVHNRASMLREAIASVIAQTDVRLELIVVDDGSTDDGCEGLESWIHSSTPSCLASLSIERNATNRGVAYARNRGVAMATASLVAFLDSDDLWARSKLARQVAFMRSSSDCPIAQTEELWLRQGRRVNPGVRHRKRSGDIFVASLRTCLVSPSAVMMRTDLFRRLGGFDERMTAAEDYDLWLRILQHHEIGLIDEPLITRRAGHSGQLSAETPAIDRYRILALLKLLNAPDLLIDRRLAVTEVLAEKCGIYGNGLQRRGHQAAAAFVQGLADRAQDWAAAPDDRLREATAAMSNLIATRQNPHRTDNPVFELKAP